MPAIIFEAPQQVLLMANPELLDILCSNLLRNAVIHNIPDGMVAVNLKSDQLTIENTGLPLYIDPQLLFERFRTADDKTKKTTGLGLAIVKQICELHGYRVSYSFRNEKHRIAITFF